nr:putative RNA-binding protein Luc7-like 1 isoform X3 [Oryctolagus cuniculus]XP_051698072.1 putative RNA-binding protein Luc7-like 1 isoform X3 [Oryctolagus cuniculus]
MIVCRPPGDETRQRVKFTDDRVCKSHLLDCCPHDILAGTRMDLGECTKIHDLALRADYEIASKERELFFELDIVTSFPLRETVDNNWRCSQLSAMDHLESFIAECDRRTELAKKRLAETQEEISAEVSAKAEKVHELNEEIGKLLAKAEQLGAEGNVDESQKILTEVEKVRAKKKEAEEEYRNSMPASSFQQQKLRVCEVCSAYLGLHDNDRRLADHFGGKLHLGFIQIREKLDQLRVCIENQRSQEVTFPGAASKAVKVCLPRAEEVFPVPVPRQTPTPPQPFAEPQPGSPPGFPGQECEIQVLQRTGFEGGVLGVWAQRAGGHRLAAGELQREVGVPEVGGEGGWGDLNLSPGTVYSPIGGQHSLRLPFLFAEYSSSFVV